ncbi:hypothetical protein L3X40_08300 [Rhizorhapis sp. SPR117]|nr:hypothetical protein [Rhizorhapis sp. SPR117]
MMVSMPEENLIDTQVKALLDLAMDAVAQARMLMSRQIHAQRAVPLDETSLTTLKQELIRGRYLGLITQQSLPRIPKTGEKGVKILLRLLDDPDQYISHRELANAAELRSPTSDAIKVYICHIRDCLDEFGYSGSMVETGLHSYRVRSENVECLIEFIINL